MGVGPDGSSESLADPGECEGKAYIALSALEGGGDGKNPCVVVPRRSNYEDAVVRGG